MLSIKPVMVDVLCATSADATSADASFREVQCLADNPFHQRCCCVGMKSTISTGVAGIRLG